MASLNSWTGTRANHLAWVLDAAFLVVLSTIGLVGLRTTYGGTAYLLVGIAGLLIGITLSEVIRRFRQPLVVEILIALLAFLLLGGAVAGRGSGIIGAAPTSHTIAALLNIGRSGWKELLTIKPPVGNAKGLLVIPYVVGLIAGVTGQSLARRTTIAAAPVLSPVVVLCLGILFGTGESAALLLQGPLFAALALAWMAVRHHRRRQPNVIGSRSRGQPVMAGAIVLVAALFSPIIGPHLPFSGGHERVVLARYVVPPFDANDYPSPLAGFREFRRGTPRSLSQKLLFTIRGVSPGALMRIATMDSYNGLVWGFGAALSASSVAQSDAFYSYGAAIPASVRGRRGTVLVKVVKADGVWLPDIGQLTSVQFSRPAQPELAAQFRYDPETGTAADTALPPTGTTYQFTVVVPSTPTPAELLAAAPGTERLPVAVPTALQTAATQWVGGATGAWAKVSALATHFRTEGRYSDGTEAPPLSAPGHSAGRLAQFLSGTPLVGKQIVGNDEQYAAALALMANAVGVPARVVIGARVPRGGRVLGADVHAWVEVSLAGLGWVTVDPAQFLPTQVPAEVQQLSPTVQFTQTPVVPPVQSILSPPSSGLPNSGAPPARLASPNGAFHLPGFVIAVLKYLGIPALGATTVSAVIILLKRKRRMRRRYRGTTPGRIAAGWHELLDLAADLGRSIPSGITRREQAVALAGSEARMLALTADAAIFGPGEPTAEQVEDYWGMIETYQRRMLQDVGRFRRFVAAVNPASLRIAWRTAS